MTEYQNTLSVARNLEIRHEHIIRAITIYESLEDHEHKLRDLEFVLHIIQCLCIALPVDIVYSTHIYQKPDSTFTVTIMHILAILGRWVLFSMWISIIIFLKEVLRTAFKSWYNRV